MGKAISQKIGRAERTALRWEIFLLLAVTFGISGLRALLRLIEALARPEALNQQQVHLNDKQSALPWLDPALQLVSSGVLVAWGALAVFLLIRHLPPSGALADLRSLRAVTARDALYGAGLAALIGIPGLALYVVSVHMGWSRMVAPSGLDDTPWRLPLLVVNAWANGWAEELVVVAWLTLRLRQLAVPWAAIFAASSLLRASYHLYQGISAGVGNLLMGVLFVWFFKRTSRVWPLIIAHGLIDTVAFVGYALLGGAPGI